MNGQLSNYEMEDIVRTTLTDNLSALEEFSGIDTSDMMSEAEAWNAAEQYLGQLSESSLRQLCAEINAHINTDPSRIQWGKYTAAFRIN